MKTFPPLARRPRGSWIASGIFLIIAGIIMIPSVVLTAIGIGFIVGGITTIVAAYIRAGRSDQ